MPSFFDSETRYEVTKEQLVQAIRDYVGVQDAVVEFDVSNKGQVRGAVVRFKRLEIKG